MNIRRKSHHQRRVEEFMLRAEQEVPVSVKIPEEDVRKLRAKLILEEALETIDGLGFVVSLGPTAEGGYWTEFIPHRHGPSIVEVMDGCADIKVVTTGTLSAFGIPDQVLQEMIDEANLQKFGPGGYKREDGKWIKPPNWTPPDIGSLLTALGWHG